MPIVRFYRFNPSAGHKNKALLERAKEEVSDQIQSIETETCFNVQVEGELSTESLQRLRWLLSETFEPQNFSDKPFLDGSIIEIGPRLNFATPWCSNALSILKACGIHSVSRIEQSRRYRLISPAPLTDIEFQLFLSIIPVSYTHLTLPTIYSV